MLLLISKDFFFVFVHYCMLHHIFTSDHIVFYHVEYSPPYPLALVQTNTRDWVECGPKVPPKVCPITGQKENSKLLVVLYKLSLVRAIN